MSLKSKTHILGFTLIELLVVISIIGLLSSVVLTSINSARIRSRDSERVQSLVQLRNALELYKADNGSYPVTDDIETPGVIDGLRNCVDIRSPSGIIDDTTMDGVGMYYNSVSPETFIPNLTPKYIATLPKNTVSGMCYGYRSNGSDYIVVATTEKLCYGYSNNMCFNHSPATGISIQISTPAGLSFGDFY